MLIIAKEESINSIIESNESTLARELALRRKRIIVKEALEPLLKVWCGKNRNNKFSRYIYVGSWYNSITIRISMAPSDSLASLFSFFEAVESIIPSTKWTCATQADGQHYGLSVSDDVHSVIINFIANIAESASCQIIPKYEMKKVLVGQTIVCKDQVM